jgi:hypothetical protein
MSAHERFKAEQWAAVVDAAPAIARAVAASAGPAQESVRELGAFERAVAATVPAGPGSDLVTELAQAVSDRIATGAPMGPPDSAIMDGIEAARKAGALLDTLASPEDALAARGWLIGLARTVASAAREGGILGIGGAVTSAPEEQTIEMLSEALGTFELDA